MVTVDRRGEILALLGALLGAGVGVALAVLAIWTGSGAVWAASFQAMGTVGIWVITWVQLHQQRLISEERLEIAALERDRQERLGGAQTIFDQEDIDQMEKLSMGRRLRAIERFLVPAMALAVTTLHLLAGFSIFPTKLQFPPIRDHAGAVVLSPTVLLFFAAGIAFVCFMFSRYALGMSRLRQWALLRAGGTYAFGTSVAALAICVGLLFLISGLPWVEVWAAYGIGAMLILMALETVANFIFDFYRPRVPDVAPRPFYDSRLLGMFSEPGGILRSIANAVDYQFGFKVSETWFYKLLGKAVLPLLLAQAVVIMALTCIVVVPPGHQAVITRNGKLMDQTAGEGIQLALPWPIDRATIIPVDRIQRIELGFEEETKLTAAERAALSGPILWTRRHRVKEFKLIVSDREASATAKVPMNLLSLDMPIQWRVKRDAKDVIRFYAQSRDAEQIIRALAYRELTRYAAQADVLDLMGRGGIRAAETLRERLQEACDRAGFDGGGLGVEIVHLGIGGVHPPPDEDVAKSYEEVVSAFEIREATIRSAEGDAAERRVLTAGTEWRALYDAICLEDVARQDEAADLVEREALVESMLRQSAGGRSRQIVATAAADSFARMMREKAAALRYESQLEAYRAAPAVFKLRAYLRMLEEGLADVRKYVLVVENSDAFVWELDFSPPIGFDAMAKEVAISEMKDSP